MVPEGFACRNPVPSHLWPILAGFIFGVHIIVNFVVFHSESTDRQGHLTASVASYQTLGTLWGNSSVNVHKVLEPELRRLLQADLRVAGDLEALVIKSGGSQRRIVGAALTDFGRIGAPAVFSSLNLAQSDTRKPNTLLEGIRARLQYGHSLGPNGGRQSELLFQATDGQGEHRADSPENSDIMDDPLEVNVRMLMDPGILAQTADVRPFLLSRPFYDEGGLRSFPMLSSFRDGYLPADDLIPMEERHGEVLYIHTWYTGSVYSGFEDTFDSLLVSQDLSKTRFIFWMDEPWLDSDDSRKQRLVNKYRHTPNRFVEFRLAVASELAALSGSCWKDRPEFLLRKPIVDIMIFSSWTNVLRVLLLHIYGGVWIDADTIVIGDYQVFREFVPDRIVAGKVYSNGEDSGDPHDTNLGVWNNNFLYLTNKGQRDVFASLSCDIRYKPHGVSRTDYSPEELAEIDFKKEWNWTMEIPVGYKGQPLRIFNRWLWNDGLLRHCSNHLGVCRIDEISMRCVDPLWMGTGDIFEFCEANVGRAYKFVETYSHLFHLVSLHGPSEGAYRYWRSMKYGSLIWNVHHRASHCRTFDVKPAGTFGFFESMIRGRLGDDPRLAPIPVMDWMAYDNLWDPLVAKPRSRNFLTIIIRSNVDHRPYRNLVRWQFAEFLHRLRVKLLQGGSADFTLPSVRLLFAVSPHRTPFGKDASARAYANAFDGGLVSELMEHADILTVGPLASELHDPPLRPTPMEGKPFVGGAHKRWPVFKGSFTAKEMATPWGVPDNYETSGILPSVLELGAMKWGYLFDSEYVLFLYQSRTALNLETLMNLVVDLESATKTSSAISRLMQTAGEDSHNVSKAFDAMNGLLMAIPRDSGTPLDGPVFPGPFDSPPAIAWDLSQPSQWNETVIDGILTTPNILPMLLSRQNPVRLEFDARWSLADKCGNFSVMAETVATRDSHGSPKTGFLGRAQHDALPSCFRRPIHPMVDNLHTLPSESFAIRSNLAEPITMLHALDADKLGLRAAHVGHFQHGIEALFPEIRESVSERSSCADFFKQRAANQNEAFNSKEAEATSREQLKRVLAVTDLFCSGTGAFIQMLA